MDLNKVQSSFEAFCESSDLRYAFRFAYEQNEIGECTVLEVCEATDWHPAHTYLRIRGQDCVCEENISLSLPVLTDDEWGGGNFNLSAYSLAKNELKENFYQALSEKQSIFEEIQ